MLSPEDLETLRGRLTAWATSRESRDPEGLASEVILRCLLAMRRGQTLNPGYPWRCARSVLVDEFRRQAGYWPLPLEMADGTPREIPAPSVDPNDGLEVAELLRPLSGRQLAVMVLWGEDDTLAATAARLGTTPGAVKKLRGRAIQTVRKAAGITVAGRSPPPRTFEELIEAAEVELARQDAVLDVLERLLGRT